MNLTNTLIFFFLILIASFSANSQNSYDIVFSSEFDERAWFVYHDKYNDEQIIILTQECPDNDSNCVSRRLIYSITNEGDTIRWPFVDVRNDTMFSINSLIIEENGDYFMVGLGWTKDSTGSLKDAFDFHTKWDVNHNIIWESIHNRPQFLNPFSDSECFKILKLIGGNYLVGKTITTVDPTLQIRYYLLEIDHSNGNVVKERYYDEFGGNSYLQSLTYNIDSTEIIMHSGRVFMPECNRNSEGAIRLDISTYDTIHTFCYNGDDDPPEKYWCVSIPYNAKLSSDNKLIVSGTGRCLTHSSIEHHIFIYQYDSAFELLDRQFLTHKDTVIDAGWYESLDINDNNEICIVGNHDRQIGPWTSHYSWIYIAKLDLDLNLIRERYLGGDAYYTVYSMASTSDGGIVTCGSRFDYLINDFDRDAFVIKTNEDLWVNQTEHNNIPIHSAIVYPNPGNQYFILRTAEYPSEIIIFDVVGRIQIKQIITEKLTMINTNNLKNGFYSWIITKENQIIDSGKWIKL